MGIPVVLAAITGDSAAVLIRREVPSDIATDSGGTLVGHVLVTRAHVDSSPVLGLGPLSVHPDHQRRGVGSALVHAVLAAADALDEPLVARSATRPTTGGSGFASAPTTASSPRLPSGDRTSRSAH
ncbi:MAG TPA: GNAT family N-acetyltransferase [Pseudonocardiaceae bacterium]